MPSTIPDRPAWLTTISAVGLVAGLALGLGAMRAAAQPADPEFAPLVGLDDEDPFEGQVIRRVTVRTPLEPEGGAEGDPGGAGVGVGAGAGYGPLPGDLENRARNAIRSYPGGPYRTETVRGDVDRLSRLISFRTVRTSVLPLEDGSVELIFTLTEQPVVSDIQVTGNRALTDQRLAQEVGDVLVGGPVERFQIERAARRMEALYRERGYYRAEVRVDEQELDDNGIVLFRVREGARVRITDIRFVGNNTFGGRFLRREIETRKAGIFRRGQIEQRTLDSDVGALIDFYRDRGYLDVRADRRITPSRDGSEAIIEFLVDEGPRYTFRDLKVEFIDAPDPVFTVEQLTGLMSIRPGDVYGEAGVRASIDVIRDAYGSLGYTDVAVVPSELRDPDRPQVDLLLRIDPGPQFKTGEVIIAGNEITRQNVIRRHIEVVPGEPLSTIGIRRTERRLEQTQLFSPLSADRGVKITLQPPDAAEPGYRDVLVEVEEANTGSINFGGAVSSDAGFFGTISLSQRNYDISDTPDSSGEFFAGRAFRGGGQTFTLNAQPGVEFQNYSLSLSEPYLFDTDYTGSGSVFFRTRDFDNFDETRVGTGLSVGRRLGTRWVGSTPIRIERVDIGSIPDDQPIDIVESQGEAVLIGLGLRLNRRTVDSRFLPNRGTLTSFGVEQVIGDFEFTRLDASYEVFLPLRGDFLGRSTVVSFATRASYIPQGPDSVPSYERLYQGGQRFRGFQFRTISPRSVRADNGEPSDVPVGGTWSYFAGLELRQPIVEDNVFVVGFIDSGTVLNRIGLEQYRVSAGVGLRLAVPQLSPAPLAFDFGFPLVQEDDDEGRLFSFSIDIPF